MLKTKTIQLYLKRGGSPFKKGNRRVAKLNAMYKVNNNLLVPDYL